MNPERNPTLDRSTARARRIHATTAGAEDVGGHLANTSAHARSGIEPTTSGGTKVESPRESPSRRSRSGSNPRARRSHASAATCAAASKTIASDNRANRVAIPAIRFGPNAVRSADASITAVAMASATMVRTRRAVASTRLAHARTASSRSRGRGRASSASAAPRAARFFAAGFASASARAKDANADDSPAMGLGFGARTRIHRAGRRGGRVRGVVDSRRRAASSRRVSSSRSTATRRHPLSTSPSRSLHSASAIDTDAAANAPCDRTANASVNAARARRTRARLVAARHVVAAWRSLARSRRDARSSNARADARRRVQSDRDARNAAMGRSRI